MCLLMNTTSVPWEAVRVSAFDPLPSNIGQYLIQLFMKTTPVPCDPLPPNVTQVSDVFVHEYHLCTWRSCLSQYLDPGPAPPPIYPSIWCVRSWIRPLYLEKLSESVSRSPSPQCNPSTWCVRSWIRPLYLEKLSESVSRSPSPQCNPSIWCVRSCIRPLYLEKLSESMPRPPPPFTPVSDVLVHEYGLCTWRSCLSQCRDLLRSPVWRWSPHIRHTILRTEMSQPSSSFLIVISCTEIL
jgi:hypothetical protein